MTPLSIGSYLVTSLELELRSGDLLLSHSARNVSSKEYSLSRGSVTGTS